MANVNVIYHHFPHYRAPVMRALTLYGQHKYRFWGDTVDYSGIKAFAGDDVVTINPLTFIGNDTGRMQIKNYWPAVTDPTADIVIIIGNPRIRATWIMAVAAKFYKKRVFFWAHGWLKAESPLKTRLRNLYYGLADKVLVYGTRAVELAGRTGFNSAKVIPIFNSLDWEAAQQAAANAALAPREELAVEFGLDPNKRTLICTARLTKTCQFDLLLRAAALLKARGSDYKIVLVGDGPERSGLERIAQADNLDVSFLGAIYDEPKLARLYRMADACVSPGKVGLTAIHSMSYGVPVITHGNLDLQMPEVEAIIPGLTGTLFEYGSADSLANTIAEWFSTVRGRAEIAHRCQEEISARWNPRSQVTLLDQTINESLANE